MVDQKIVVGVDGAAVVEVAIEEAFGLRADGKAGVDAGVIVGVNDAAEIGVAVIGVLDQDGVGVDGLARERSQNSGVVAAIVDDCAEGICEGGIGGGAGAADPPAGPCASARPTRSQALTLESSAALDAAVL